MRPGLFNGVWRQRTRRHGDNLMPLFAGRRSQMRPPAQARLVPASSQPRPESPMQMRRASQTSHPVKARPVQKDAAAFCTRGQSLPHKSCPGNRPRHRLPLKRRDDQARPPGRPGGGLVSFAADATLDPLPLPSSAVGAVKETAGAGLIDRRLGRGRQSSQDLPAGRDVFRIWFAIACGLVLRETLWL